MQFVVGRSVGMSTFRLTALVLILTATPALAQDEAAKTPTPAEEEDEKEAIDRTQLPFCERLGAAFWQEDDTDGPIATDRPTFTPANTVVPRGRLQIESGYTFAHDLTATTERNTQNFPELATRYGLTRWLEFRTFWTGATYSRTISRTGKPTVNQNGFSDTEFGFKSQLLVGDKDRIWRPTTALITSVIAPTGGNSPFGSQQVSAYASLIYGWNLTERFSIAGSSAYLGVRLRNPGLPGSFSAARLAQSLVATYAATDRATLFYEWYVFEFVSSRTDNRPTHYMDGGLLFRPTPNTQIDLRAGFGLGDRPDDFFTGAGYSIRF